MLSAALVTAACGGGSGSSASGSSSTAATTTTTAAANADPVEWAGTFCEGIGPTVEGVMNLLKTMFEGGAEDPAVQKAEKAMTTVLDGKAAMGFENQNLVISKDGRFLVFSAS